jgi:hypothetical protein
MAPQLLNHIHALIEAGNTARAFELSRPLLDLYENQPIPEPIHHLFQTLHQNLPPTCEGESPASLI